MRAIAGAFTYAKIANLQAAGKMRAFLASARKKANLRSRHLLCPQASHRLTGKFCLIKQTSWMKLPFWFQDIVWPDDRIILRYSFTLSWGCPVRVCRSYLNIYCTNTHFQYQGCKKIFCAGKRVKWQNCWQLSPAISVVWSLSCTKGSTGRPLIEWVVFSCQNSAQGTESARLEFDVQISRLANAALGPHAQHTRCYFTR